MILKDMLEVLTGPDELLIVRAAEKEADQKTLYKGYRGPDAHMEIPTEIMQETVRQFRIFPEIRSREWKERNLMPPMDADKTPDFLFSDLQMSLYYKIII